MNTLSMETNFEELKKQWDNVVTEKQSHESLLKMTHASTNPRLRKLMMKLMLETGISLLVVLMIILIAQWREMSPWLLTGTLICNAFFLFNNLFGFSFLRRVPMENTIRGAMKDYHARMRTMLVLSSVAGFLMSIFLLASDFLFLTTNADRFIFSMFLVPLSLLCFWRADQWRMRAKEVRAVLGEFDQ